MKIKLQRVDFMPKQLEAGTLYVAEEFGAAAHLCACGCGAKIRTPLGPTDWILRETAKGVSLYPSIGNWQQACQSHYWILRGEIVWARKWSAEQIRVGRRREQALARLYFRHHKRRQTKHEPEL
jgi:hypothetical protein